MLLYVPALQIRAGQWSITTSLGTLTAHAYHLMITVTGGSSKKSFFYFYFLEILLNGLELVFLEFKHIYKTQKSSLFSFYLFCFLLIVS